jgi:hypothetical protein
MQRQFAVPRWRLGHSQSAIRNEMPHAEAQSPQSFSTRRAAMGEVLNKWLPADQRR